MNLIIPKNYKSSLSARETQDAIKFVRTRFEQRLSSALNLSRVTAPVFVAAGEGINDDLSGSERKVDFTMKNLKGVTAEIVQSLAKWKRIALSKYDFKVGEGLYTNMNAIRRDDDIDNLHSIYVDQWDWELVIDKGQRKLAFLEEVAKKIVGEIALTSREVTEKFPALGQSKLSEKVLVISSQELEDKYPNLSAKERENKIVKEHKSVVLTQIGGKLKSGKPHDSRAPDYDDWSMNCDILFWCDVLDCAVEISSMGIRVDEAALKAQLKIAGCLDRAKLKYHKMLLEGELPLTIGGGIGQSRVCLLLLNKAHLGEVHASIWSKEMVEECRRNNIELL
ncbi:MAG: aspartate--ammonia ligase [Firmicutes bacterium]|nr:aspartate--ammonia ligase [Bacillota bacterium]